MDCNKEHLLRITCDRAVAKVSEDFENDWKTAEGVTPSMITKMLNRYRERSRVQSEGTSADQSAPEERGDFQRSASLNRDLMSELDT
eukprot:8939317-Karenia_brevis.AAC.1